MISRGRVNKYVTAIKAWVSDMLHIVVSSDMNLLASSLAFSTTLSIVPLLAVSLSVYEYMGGLDRLISELTPKILSALASGTDPSVVTSVIAAVKRMNANTVGLFGFLSLLFTSTMLVYGIEMSIQKVWGVESQRRIFTRLLGYWGVIFFVPLSFAVFWGIVQSGFIPYAPLIPHSLLIWFAMTISFVAILKWVPATRVRWSSAFIGGIFIGVVLTAAQKIYVWLVANILIYNKVYGSIASVPILLLWLLLGWYIFFFGTAIAARRNQLD